MTFDAARLFRDLTEAEENYVDASFQARNSYDVRRASEFYGYARALRSIAKSIRNGDYDGDE